MNKKAQIIMGIVIGFLVISTLLIINLDIFYDDDGIIDPNPSYQRYRRDEYDADKPFFQWWYFTIKDLDHNRYWALDYSIVDCVSDLTNEGAYMMFSTVDDTTGTRFHKYERYALSDLEIKNAYDLTLANQRFSLKVLDANTYHLFGEMNDSSRVWYADGCEEDLYIAWNLTIHRIYGWYGQQDVESSLKMFGVINWNTYAHDSEVEGTIQVGNETYTIDRSVAYRAYCDENWGENFPSGSPAIDYPWGWYYAGLPNTTLSQEISIIAGTGRHDAGFPFGTCLGKFADIRLPDGVHIGMRQNEIWSSAYSLMETSNDGDVELFTVERSAWENYTDGYGTALIPMRQIVTLQTVHYRVIMDFQSEATNYNRLLFAHEAYIFSDFEGLGVNCDVSIAYRTSDTDPEAWNIIYEFHTDDAGLEYGYNVEE